MMLVNPEKYKENMHLDTIFDTSLDLWLKHNRKEVEDYIQGNDIRTLGNSDNTTWILDTLAENDPEILDLLLVKVANDRIQRILPGEKHLQTWLDNNPTNWLQEGGNLLTRILEDTKVTNPIGNSMVVRTLLGTLSHYQQHPTELKENLLNQATEGQIWLELIDGMLDKETKDSLVEGILEDPRQPADKIAWATLRAANVDLSEENIPGPRVKLKKPKEGRDTPSRGI
jgi:hypothetical protein